MVEVPAEILGLGLARVRGYQRPLTGSEHVVRNAASYHGLNPLGA
jgi:hypothetical protein